MPNRRPIFVLACLLIACPLFGAGNRMMLNPRTFTAEAPYPNGGVRVGDFNGDGKQDVLVIGSSSVASYAGNGDGTFAAGIQSGNSASTYEAQNLADFNGDGRPDVLVSKYRSASFGILLGQGGGTFGAPVSTTTVNAVVGAVAGDFDGDGKVDVLTHERPAPGQNVFVLYAGNGAGGFAAGVPSTMVASFDEYRTLRAGDFDGDGKLDVAGALSSNETQIFFNNGDRTFAPAAFRLAGQVRTVADFNSDGVSDLITIDNTSVDGLTRAFLGRSSRGVLTAL
ncbi:MAG: VCBS repeat-containing protein, partial [Acidobacteria bacterium]|nr:VCBS repeat-containing protein [Acidobacteriota bacterium]